MDTEMRTWLRDQLTAADALNATLMRIATALDQLNAHLAGLRDEQGHTGDELRQALNTLTGVVRTLRR